jgi:hypothetical protein
MTARTTSSPSPLPALIEQKIGALGQAAPLAEWDLPAKFQTLRRLMGDRNPLKRRARLRVPPARMRVTRHLSLS